MGINCVKFFTGVYFCNWRSNENYRDLRSARCEKLFSFSVALTFLFCTAWLYSWSVLSNDADDVNDFLYDELHFWFQWYILILAISVAAASYLFIVFVSGLFSILINLPLHLGTFNKVAVVFCFSLLIAAFAILGNFWPGDGDQWASIAVSFNMTSPFLQICAIVIWVVFAVYICLVVRKITNLFFKIVIFVNYAVFFIFLITIPIWLTSPCIGRTSQKNPKPHLIGHKGAPTLAPENTLMSYEKAIGCGVYAFESDVRFSLDGKPFLMHDTTLLRTTNVADIFSQRKNNRAESFSWAELQQLNAGDWYLETDPFLTNSDLTAADRKNISLQKIPSLSEYATYAKQQNKSIIFDLNRPYYNHTNYFNWVNVTIATLLQSGIPQKQVLWLYDSNQDLSVVKELAPDFRLVEHHAVTNVSGYEVDIFNLPYSKTTKQVLALNHPVISYTIDTSWTFSRSWCQGVWSVTTNKCPLLSKMTKPSWALTPKQYLGMWVPIDIIAVLAVSCILYFFYKKAKMDEMRLVTQIFDDDIVLT